MEFTIGGKVALITGGSSGLGYHIGRELLKHGLKGIAILDIDDKKGTVVQDEFTNEFGQNCCIFLKTDVTDESQMEDGFKKTVDSFKQLDIVINNAGILSELKWKQCLDINLKGCIAGTILAIDNYLPEYKSGYEGVIVNIASVVGIQPWGILPVYTATKQGIVGISRAFGVKEHYERAKVKVLAICPGSMSTPMAIPTPDNYKMDYVQYFQFASEDYPLQEPEFVAQSLINIIRSGDNGSVWIVEGGQPAYEVEFQNKFSMCRNKL